MRYSQDAVDLVTSVEGLHLESYQDAGGVWTIGWGHTQGVTAGMQITLQRAVEFLTHDMAVAERAIDALVTVPLTQAMFDALVVFVFNIGVTAFADSTLLDVLNRGDYLLVPQQMLRWVYSGGEPLLGLAVRRASEVSLFLQQGLP